jgi:hypothetical protein
MNIIEPIHWIFRQFTPESWDSYTALVSIVILFFWLGWELTGWQGNYLDGLCRL